VTAVDGDPMMRALVGASIVLADGELVRVEAGRDHLRRSMIRDADAHLFERASSTHQRARSSTRALDGGGRLLEER
jgi:hypothetical protein